MHYFRLITIIFVIFKFGLDEFIGAHIKFKFLHKCIKTLLFWRNTAQPRGERLRLALEKLGPIFVKFGQMLSTRRDLLPPDVADELAKLQDRVPPFAFSDVKKSIEEAFNLPLNQVYSDFSEVAVASASVAQVHFAHLLDGTPVAVKVLRPGIAKVINQDLNILKSLAWLLQAIICT